MDAPPYRKQLRRWEGDGDVRFLTFSCYQRLPLLQNAAIRDAFVEQLGTVLTSNGESTVKLVAWVVMRNHVHLLIQPRDEGVVADITRSLKSSFAQRVIARWRELDAPILAKIVDAQGRCHFWQLGGGYDRNIRNERELSAVIDYIHENPVSAGLCDLPHQWKWSSAPWYEGLPYTGPPITNPE